MSDALHQAIARATHSNSPYWFFRQLDGIDPRQEREVEIRIDVAPENISRLNNEPGWRVWRSDPGGMVFLRRKQTLTDQAVRNLIRDGVVIAHSHSGVFHSWVHDPDVGC